MWPLMESGGLFLYSPQTKSFFNASKGWLRKQLEHKEDCIAEAVCVSQNPKYFSHRPLQKKFADPTLMWIPQSQPPSPAHPKGLKEKLELFITFPTSQSSPPVNLPR